MITIAIANQKGGVGKTTTTVNLAHHFARQGKKVLVIDFDVQGHAATCLGLAKGPGLFRWLVLDEGADQAKTQARENLDLIAGDKRTEKVKPYLSDMVGRELYIGRCLEDVKGYDLAFLDLAPGSDLLHVGALAASDYVIIPAKMDFLALDGVMEILSTVRSLASLPMIEPPSVLGVLPTLYDRTTSETAANLAHLAEAVSADLVLPPVPLDTHMREATARGMTIWEYAPDTAAAIGYELSGSGAKNSRGRMGGYLHLAEIVEAVVK